MAPVKKETKGKQANQIVSSGAKWVRWVRIVGDGEGGRVTAGERG
jgi:hypothetical protein